MNDTNEDSQNPTESDQRSESTDTGGGACNTPQDLLEILGPETVLLPVEPGTKKPALNEWSKVTVADTRSAEYLRRLCQGNIGVLLGSASSHLCAIDIDNDDAVEAFFELNPRLRSTLRTRGARGEQIWVRLIGEYPKWAKLQDGEDQPYGEWRSDGAQSVIHGRHALATGFANYLRGEVERENAFQRKRDFIHVKNGVLRIENAGIKLVEFDPEFYSRNIAPFEYDPAAQCPRFLRELLEPALNAADILLIQKWAGSVLLGRNIAQRFLLVTGTAGGGKSTLMNVIEAIIGAQNVAQLRTDHLGERFELFRCDGKTLLTGKDVAANFLMRKSAHVIKALVGHDLLEAEKKNSNERVQLRGDFNIAITCNSQLKVRLEGDTGAWGRRLLIVNYDKPKPAKPIADFATTLIREEGAGILNWMVEGALLHLAELGEHGDYQLTPEQRRRIDMLLAESDSIRKFVEDWVITTEGQSVASQQLLEGYFEYCESMQWEGYTPDEVKRALPNVMRDVHRANLRHDISYLGKTVRGYRGFSIAR